MQALSIGAHKRMQLDLRRKAQTTRLRHSQEMPSPTGGISSAPNARTGLRELPTPAKSHTPSARLYETRRVHTKGHVAAHKCSTCSRNS